MYSGRPRSSLGFFTLDDILLGREHEELFHSFSSDLGQCVRLGQQSTVAWPINDLNEFTGFWYDAQGAEHGFVALAVR